MAKQIIFIVALAITAGVFLFTLRRIISFFRLTKPYKISKLPARFGKMMLIAIGQTRLFRMPLMGFLHALVFWGFCVILIGSIEIVVDGIAGTHRFFAILGPVYDIIIALGDIFAALIALCILVFLFRRLFLNIKRFSGIEMAHKSHLDANLALTMIFLLMISLTGTNIFYINLHPADYDGIYPVSAAISPLFTSLSFDTTYILHEISWWAHILLIFIFANILPYSKHFHVFMSVPNVFLSRLEPLGKLDTMTNITKEIRMMLNPELANSQTENEPEISRFGVKDVEDAHWKNYFDSLSCTECGRCTSACPANTTGKKLSPRKVMIDFRARMKEKGPLLIKNGKDFSDNKSLIRDYISEEEIWACTTCNACAAECPICINHPTLIVDLRRFLVMEESSAPSELNAVFSNIENNGAPWQFSPEDRILWTQELYINTPQA